MKRSVGLSIAARKDIAQLEDFLAQHSLTASRRASETLRTALNGLADFAEIGHPRADGLRELYVPFGASGYVVRYRVRLANVTILRIWHGREQR